LAKDNRKISSFLRVKGVILLVVTVLLVVLLSLFFGDRGIVEIVRLQNQIREMEVAIAELEKEIADLKREIEQLSGNPLALEKVAREKLWLMKPKEKVVVILD